MLIAYIGLATIWDGPPRTLSVEIDNWSNRSWGFHDVERGVSRCRVAVASDGSRMNECELTLYRHYFLQTGSWKRHGAYNKADHTGFTFDDAARTARGGPCSCTWTALTALPDDNSCSRTAETRLKGAEPTGWGEVAGHKTVVYRLLDEEGMLTEMSLAPKLECEVMEMVRTWPGTLGIPGARERYRVTAYQPGEPDPRLFRVPPGYVIVRDPQ